MTILGYDVRIYFLLFIIYAVAGWIMEVTCKLIQYKRFINRGFSIADERKKQRYLEEIIQLSGQRFYWEDINMMHLFYLLWQ